MAQLLHGHGLLGMAFARASMPSSQRGKTVHGCVRSLGAAAGHCRVLVRSILVPSSVLVTTSKAPVTTSFLLLLVRHLLLVAMHLFLVASLLLLVRHLLLVAWHLLLLETTKADAISSFERGASGS